MPGTVFEFGDFKLDCDRFELYRAGRSVKLERKPMELLILLATKEGHLVSRTEIAERLWAREVFVDTEHGINTAVRKIRQALRDDPEAPTFLLTVTGKGYRFIGTTTNSGQPSSSDQGQLSSTLANSSNASIDSPVSTAPAADVPLLTGESKSKEHCQSRTLTLRRGVFGMAAVVALIVAITLGSRGAKARFESRIGTPEIKSLAVLPLDNLSGDPSQEYFADGMTDELITMLAKNSTLRVTSRTSVMQYKGVHRPLPEIARELGVDGILEGSVVHTGDKVHLTIQLIQAPSDTHVWAESYDRTANDSVALPREASLAIAKKLNRAVLQSTPSRFVSPEAHDAYLRGRYIWFAGSNDEAGKYFRKATELQPDYALGWSGLSVYYSAGAIGGELKPEDSVAQGEMAALRAAELDDSLPEAHLALAGAMLVQWHWARAEQEVNRAIELDPKFAEAYHLRSKILAAVNRQNEAIDSQKKATELDPFSRTFAMGLSYLEARRYDEALADAHMRLETTPQDIGLHWVLYEAYRRMGRQKEAVAELQQVVMLWGDKQGAEKFGQSFREGGYKAVLRRKLSDLERDSQKRYHSPVEWAGLYAELGPREKALSLLEEAYRHHSPTLFDIQNDPAFDFLHSEPRYRLIIDGMGLPPAY
jgi:TolB-like protein/DNA-binding winged helix-turn-helix (wHTH) protein